MEVAQEGKWFQTREKQTEKSKAVCVWRGGEGGSGGGEGGGGVWRVGEGAGSYSIVPAGREWVLSKYLLF